MRIKDAQLVPCKLFIEYGDRTFDALEVEYAVDPSQNISRRMALEIEQNSTQTIQFIFKNGMLPVQGPFLCIPYDVSRPISQAFVYETKIFPRTMDLEIFYENPGGRSLHVLGKYRDTAAQTRLHQAVEKNSILPLFFIRKASLPLKNGVFEWTPEFKDNILIVRLWNNKMLRATAGTDEPDLPSS
ncbi:MAG: hypothetical protein A2Y56_02970 [Candidatus Aminicenantes bacterium RBG_13_63_10]|nr:MAG: hypothetical protein A2Y56_02970 [Candidatus Aminicenantes bacterium RBG_13_63_10]